MNPSARRFLTIYSGVLTLGFAVTVLSGLAGRSKKASFDEITVRRINIIEPDGTLRMILSNKTDAPGLFIRGKEYPHPERKTAGVIFVDDEGTENGGLIFGGSKTKDGKVESWGHLSFDQYQQDQVFTIDAAEEASKSGIDTGPAQRAYLGRAGDGSVGLKLKDKQGRDRILLRVDADGTPVLQFLDANGKMTAQLPPEGR